MKYKKFIICGTCITLIISYIGIKEHKGKTTSNNSNVVTSENNKSKTNTEGISSSVSSTQTSFETSKLDITMLDTTPNTQGNSSENLSNGGYFAKQGKWIYFTLPPVNAKQHPIYRAMSDGETALKAITLEGTFRCINVIGDWVYYINENYSSYIYRTKTDGSSTEIVLEYPVFNMFIKDGYIYYSAPDGISRKGLKALKEDRGTLIAKGSTYNYFYTYDNLIYTPIFEEKSNPVNNKGQIAITNLYTMNLDGSNFKKINNEFLYNFIINKGYIFYINYSNQTLYRMNLNGSNKIQLFSFPISNYNISNNSIYYQGYGDNQNNIYKSDLNGKEIKKLTNNAFSYNRSLSSIVIEYISSIHVIDDYVYYLGSYGANWNLYKTKTDGSLTRLLS